MYRMLKITPEELIKGKENLKQGFNKYQFMECYTCKKPLRHLRYFCDCCIHYFCGNCYDKVGDYKSKYIFGPENIDSCPCYFLNDEQIEDLKCIGGFRMKEIINNPFNITINAGIEEILNEYDESLKKENNIIEI